MTRGAAAVAWASPQESPCDFSERGHRGATALRGGGPLLYSRLLRRKESPAPLESAGSASRGQ